MAARVLTVGRYSTAPEFQSFSGPLAKVIEYYYYDIESVTVPCLWLSRYTSSLTLACLLLRLIKFLIRFRVGKAFLQFLFILADDYIRQKYELRPIHTKTQSYVCYDSYIHWFSDNMYFQWKHLAVACAVVNSSVCTVLHIASEDKCIWCQCVLETFGRNAEKQTCIRNTYQITVYSTVNSNILHNMLETFL